MVPGSKFSKYPRLVEVSPKWASKGGETFLTNFTADIHNVASSLRATLAGGEDRDTSESDSRSKPVCGNEFPEP